MDSIEVLGGIKAESLLIKTEPSNPDEANIVEISAEDIQDEIKREENAELGNLEDGRNNNDIVRISAENIKLKKENEKTDYGKRKQKSLDKNKTDLSKTETIQEKLILNYAYEVLPNENKKNKKPSEESYLDKKVIGRDEYALTENKQYRCNRCQHLATSKKYVLKHIRHYHRSTVIFFGEKQLFQKLDTLNSTSRHVGWYEYIPESGDQYRCNHCQALVEGQRQTEKHIREEHRTVKMNQCPHCPYQSRFDISSHILSVHTNEKDIEYFRCHKCDYKSKLKNGLRRHMFHVHTDNNEMKKCPQCPKTFRKRDGLTKHIHQIHSAESMKKIQCFHCSFECKTKTGMIHHIESHHRKPEDLETLKCEQCAFKTKFKARMQAHISHSHKYVLQCHICSYQCTAKHILAMHLIGHNKEKHEKDLRYRCDKCDYKTHRMYSLQVHKLNHLKPEEIQYFYCYHCSFKAKRKDNLKSHIYRHYKKDELLFQCYICDFTTSKRDQLFRHIDMHSKNQKEVKKPKTKIISHSDGPSKKLIPVKVNKKSKIGT